MSEPDAQRAGTEAARAASLRAVLGLWLLGALFVYCVSAFPDGIRGRAYAALTILELGLALLATRLTSSQRDAICVVRVGVLARLCLLLVPAFTSNDATRYVWDGAAALAGFDPYTYSPRGIALHVHGFAVPEDNAGYVTLYPPAALGLFVLAASTGAHAAAFVWKLIVTLASIATVHVSLRALVRDGRERWIALVALSPMLVLEGGVGAHLDVVAALAVACGVAAWQARRFGRASAWLALGGLLKLSPALGLVPLFFAAPRSARVRMVAAGSSVFLGGYGLAMLAGLRPIGSLGAFFTDWRFGSPVFFVLERALGAKAALGVASVVIVAMLAVSVLVARRIDALCGVLVALVAPFVASPVVFPWYLAAQTPLVALRPSATWIGWAGALPLTYEVLDRVARGAPWSESGLVLAVVGLVVASGALADLRSSRRRSAPSTDGRAV